ncbi:hypothetical protein TRIUR3_10873 [Triticum urartu]|uniref:Protein FAM33A n=1 Tax=Triticum urartu TaxID=4572 RepID=M7ZQP4_TRIUA|nr:hypothetical protein TRIUR3_10873 [Triticum urartu]
MAADRRHPAVNDVYLTLVGASNTLADVQRRLDLEFRASYPDHDLADGFIQANPAKLVGRVKRVQEEVAALKDLCRDLLAQKQANPAKLVGRVKRVQEEVAALKDLCRDLLAQKQELIDMMRTSLAAQRSATQRLLASSGLPLMTDDEEAACASLKQVIDEWTDQLKPMAGGPDGENEDTNQILFSAIL